MTTQGTMYILKGQSCGTLVKIMDVLAAEMHTASREFASSMTEQEVIRLKAGISHNYHLLTFVRMILDERHAVESPDETKDYTDEQVANMVRIDMQHAVRANMRGAR